MTRRISQLIPRIAAALKPRDCSRKTTINAPALDIETLHSEWESLRREARHLQPASLPSPESLTRH